MARICSGWNAKTHRISQCNLNYMNRMKIEAYQMKDHQEIAELHQLMERHILDYCQREFQHECSVIHKICSSDSDCGELTKGFLMVLEDGSHWHN